MQGHEKESNGNPEAYDCTYQSARDNVSQIKNEGMRLLFLVICSTDDLGWNNVGWVRDLLFFFADLFVSCRVSVSVSILYIFALSTTKI